MTRFKGHSSPSSIDTDGNGDDRDLLTPMEDDGTDPLLTPEATKKKSKSPKRRDLNGFIDTKPIHTSVRSPLKSKLVESANKYKRLKMVGKGQYGQVYKAENVMTKEIVACKVASKHEDPVLRGFPLSLIREISIMRQLNHDAVVRMIEVVASKDGAPIIVMEYCQASLLELLQSESHALMMGEIKYIGRQILDAVAYMHRLGILHRDLAAKNILFNQSGEIKVCDFGISRHGFSFDKEAGFIPASDLEPPHLCVSLHYRSIELLLGDISYGPPLDVWSIGCILAEILISQAGRRQPFFGGERENPNKSPQMTTQTICTILGRPTDDTWEGVTSLPGWDTFKNFDPRDYPPQRVGKRQEKEFLKDYFTSGDGKPVMTKFLLSDGVFSLLSGLLTLCPKSRISAQDALDSSFFKEKPLAEWHAWHWATSVCQIDEQKCFRDSKETLKRQLKEHDKQLSNEKKMRLGGSLPPGWNKKWSNSNKKYYYYHAQTTKTQWEIPTC